MKKSGKGAIVIITLLIVIIIALAGGMVYLYVNQNKNGNTTNDTTNNIVVDDNNSNTVSNNIIADELLYSGRYNTVAFIENGNVYLSRIGAILGDGYNASIETIKVSGITGKVLKLRGYSVDNTPEYKYFLMTEEGKVYSVGYQSQAQEETYFKDYNVVDILSAEKIEDSSYRFATKYIILTKEIRKFK